MQQIFAISQRQPHRFWRQVSNWPLKLINFDDVRFAPIGDGFDADDDFHRLPRQAGNASILDTQTDYPKVINAPGCQPTLILPTSSRPPSITSGQAAPATRLVA